MPSGTLYDVSSKDLIFAAVGVLSGNRFSGGSLKGCRFFFPILAVFLGLGSLSGTKDDFRDEFMLSVGVCVDCPDSVSAGLSRAAASVVNKLEDLAEKNGCSTSLWGDSKAFGIAGTGGTSSLRPPNGKLSRRGFGVVNLEVDAL